MQVHRRLAVLVASAAALIAAAPAHAGIWTPVASGTTSDLTAVDWVSPTNLVYGTSGGAILKNGAIVKAADGFGINDVAFDPSGTVGLAAANNGRLWRSTNGGASWAAVSLVNTTHTFSTCLSSPSTAAPVGTPTGNLQGVAWGDGSTAYVVGADPGMVLKTVTAGAIFGDVSRQADQTCRVGVSNSPFTDVNALSAGFVWFVTDDFGERWLSTDGVASPGTHYNSTAANCFSKRPRLAVDHDNPNRLFVTDRCEGNLQFGVSEDAGVNFDISPNFFAGDEHLLTGLNDVAIAGGSTLAVGNGGAILVTNNGRDVYFQRADNDNGDWLATDKLDAANAVVVGKGGRIVETAQANTIPDVVAPAGTISGPTTATAGTPATFTANLADDAGGSGINPASIAWSATGVPSATGNPVALTFPSAGFYTVRVDFKDNAGNAGSATLGVTVGAPPPPPPPAKPAPTTLTKTVTSNGGSISFGVPRACVHPGQTFTVTLTFKKQKRKGNKFVKVTRTDFYIGAKRVKIDKQAPFRQTLRVTVKAKAGSTISLKARAYIKVKRGKSPKKSITSKIRVCG